MLGGFAVGKTCLVSRYVQGLFSDDYLTTIGVKIDRKRVAVDDQRVDLILWDLNGEDEFLEVNMSYLRGLAGYLLVVDGTRAESLGIALDLRQRTEDAMGEVPFVLALNKSDLSEEWEISTEDISGRLPPSSVAIETSAKTGDGVEECFQALTRLILEA